MCTLFEANPLKVTIFYCVLLLLFHHGTKSAAGERVTKFGSIINLDSRNGKEAKVAMEIAAQNFNNFSVGHRVSLHFRNSLGNPLEAANAAEELILEKGVHAIIGMETWEEAALVAGVGKQARVPIISFASVYVEEPILSLRWPFLVQMGSNIAEQIKCISAIISSFDWQKVIPVYEVDSYGGNSGILLALSEALQVIDVEIEYRLVFPPFSSLSDPKEFVCNEVSKLLTKQSRVFIILQSSLPLAIHLFTEAKQIGLVGKDTVWIIMDNISSQLDSVNTSVISSMEGALGIKTYFPEDTLSFLEFKHQFRQGFKQRYLEEDNYEMGIYALWAYDSVNALAMAKRRLDCINCTSTVLLKALLSSNFTGLSGDINFDSGRLSQISLYRIVNIVGKRYKELGFWSSKIGFSKTLVNGGQDRGDSMQALAGLVNWPGDLKRIPKGWSMPTDSKPLKFGVPVITSFEKFVKVSWNPVSEQRNYSGFCIEVFHEVLRVLKEGYDLPYELIPFNGTYDDLVDFVANKTFDAVIGDVTILANRSKYVEFTQPFVESGLSMIVTVRPHSEKGWIFLKPFTMGMWALTGAMMIYTVLIVCLLERKSSPEFEGSWPKQLNVALWFTSSSLFFAQRESRFSLVITFGIGEQIYNNYARLAVTVWLFVVLALSSSYTASLSSMLTAPRLEPNVTDISWLKKHNATVGCDGYSFVRKYLENVLGFHPANIKNINSEYDYPKEFESGNIAAAFLEVPYEKAFLNHHCKGYTVAGTSERYGGDRFGGFGFVFQKGSPISADVSRAILTLLENGRLKQLEIEWFAPSAECKTSKTSSKTDSLSWHSFWGLFLFSAATSTFCYLVHIAHQLYDYVHVVYNDLKNKFTMLQDYVRVYVFHG